MLRKAEATLGKVGWNIVKTSELEINLFVFNNDQYLKFNESLFEAYRTDNSDHKMCLIWVGVLRVA